LELQQSRTIFALAGESFAAHSAKTGDRITGFRGSHSSRKGHEISDRALESALFG